MSKDFSITGAGRGLGMDAARQALAAGNEAKAGELLAQVHASRELGSGLAHTDAA
jgi:hypothetical protein